MKWFLKSLKQYADFNGRASRTEFWVFMLFNILFALVWSFMLALAFLFLSEHSNHSIPRIIYIVSPSYFILLMLPTLAVAVRRLHDIGKSGWILLVGLIPVIGEIWLLALMLTKGQNKTNKYGLNPTTSEDTFDIYKKRKSAGVALMATASVVLFFSIVFEWLVPVLSGHTSSFTPTLFLLLNILSFASIIILLITGFIIWKGDAISNIREKRKQVMILLFSAIFISLMLSIFYSMDNFTVNSVFHILFYLSIALFALSFLFSSQDRQYIRYTAMPVIFFSSVCLLSKIYISLKMNNQFENGLITQLQYLCETFYILMPIAFIIFVDAFVQEEENFIPMPTALPIPPVKDNAVFVREDRSSIKVWQIFKAPNKDDAIAFLSKQQITRPFFYVVVETPEGDFWKDYKGVFQD